MSNRPLKTKHFVKYLEFIKCNYVRTTASHEHWRCPNCFRTITFQGKNKDIPGFHIHTLAKTLGVNTSEIYEWIDKNC
jgi:transposase-like protein